MKEWLRASEDGNAGKIAQFLLFGFDINVTNPIGMTALHIAVARNRVDVVRTLIERGAAFGPDNLGRWPSVVAAKCRVSEEMCDLVVEAEAEWLAKHEQEDPDEINLLLRTERVRIETGGVRLDEDDEDPIVLRSDEEVDRLEKHGDKDA